MFSLANSSIFTQCIGEDNYEAVVNTVNKVGYLYRYGLEDELKYYNSNSTLCEEYQKLLIRVIDIYNAIDEYFAKNSFNVSNLLRFLHTLISFFKCIFNI